MVTAQRTSVEVLRRELHLRFQDELMNEVQGPSDVISELVLDPVGESAAFPLFFQKFTSRSKRNSRKQEGIRAGRRVPSPKEGDAPPHIPPCPDILPYRDILAYSDRSPYSDASSFPDVLPFPSNTTNASNSSDSSIDAPFPPLTSRGVTIPKESETLNNKNCENSPQVSGNATTEPTQKILGGYDGGVEVGFNGRWSDLKFKNILQTLETAKTAAENECSDDRFVELGGYTFSVQAHGANCGAHYKYVIEGSGVKVYIHANPKGPIQPVRLRYGFEALGGRDLFAVHAKTLDWLKDIGFHIEKETVSRVDLQVMLLRAIADFMAPIFGNRSVKRASKFTIHGKNNKLVTSFTLGSTIQLCIYDKRQELIDTCDEVKMSLIVNDCLGGEFPDELTRIEYRLRRDGLRCFGINTIQDLLERENALVDYLTFDWFRLLKDEKDRSNSALQELDPIWQEVRDLFFEYFPGAVENRKPIERHNSRREIKCTGDSLIKQAVGCIATAAALCKGVLKNEAAALTFVRDVVSEKVQRLLERTRQRVVELGIVRGVEVPDAMDWHLDHRYACESHDAALREFRVVYDEDLQYERVRQYAVAGCPF